MLHRLNITLFIIIPLVIFFATTATSSYVVREKGRVYIVDQTGDRWDVTQAETIGFRPEGFQYGMGRNYFKPLDDSHLKEKTEDISSRLRVIGITKGSDSKAFSVSKLGRHEIANSSIGSEPVAVGY